MSTLIRKGAAASFGSAPREVSSQSGVAKVLAALYIFRSKDKIGTDSFKQRRPHALHMFWGEEFIPGRRRWWRESCDRH